MIKMQEFSCFYIYLHFYIIPALFAYFLACYPYILLHFNVFSFYVEWQSRIEIEHHVFHCIQSVVLLNLH